MAEHTHVPVIPKITVKSVRDTCYSAAYMSQTRDQQRFTISVDQV